MGGAKPAVTLTFAGDSEKLTKAMSEVGRASEDMGRRVESASDGMRSVGHSAEDLAEKTDTVDTRAMGLADTFAGVRDGLAAWNDESISTGEKIQTLAMAGSDLASGFTNFLIPTLANTRLGMMAVTGATRLWSLAQNMLNVSFWVSPIGLITIGVVALIAVIVLIAAKTDWFQRLWAWAWSGIKAVALAVWDWLRGLPDRLGDAFGRIPTVISAPFRAGFNMVSAAWNNTVGRLHWTIPSWVPGLGGMNISAPRLPTFHSGGTVPGRPGQEVLSVLLAGETVTPAGQAPPGGVVRVEFVGDVDSAFASAFMGLVRKGDIQIVVAP